MNQTYAEENTAERQRLNNLTARLTDEHLARRLGNGWSVAAALIHLAFWDQCGLARVKEWERTGFTPSVLTGEVVNVINDAVFRLSEAIPPRAAIQLAQAAAEAADRAVERITPQLAETIEAGGHARVLRRAAHRREHLNQIERAIGA